MVAIQRPTSSKSKVLLRINVLDRTVLFVLVSITLLYVAVFSSDPDDSARLRQQTGPGRGSKPAPPREPIFEGSINVLSYQCPYMSISDLTKSEMFPQQGPRHMVDPPRDEKITLVCCNTTAGPWNIAAHHDWSPRGAEGFLKMVRSGYFSATVPLMRCMKGFLCQFGLTADPKVTKQYHERFPDDPNWLPEGPKNRVNEFGVNRFAKGYMAYAGAGPNSRSNQFIVSLDNNKQLAGGSPWEVPWGELVGDHSFETLDKIYTGYGGKGPGQSELKSEGVTDEMRQRFPHLDYVLSCNIVDEIDIEAEPRATTV